MVPWNVALIAWLDDRMGIEAVGMAQGPARSGHLLSDDWSAVEAFAQREGFPQHWLVLRPESQDDPRMHKGIADWTGCGTASTPAKLRPATARSL